MFVVYLAVNSFLLFLDTMQKLLNNKLAFAIHSKQIFSNRGWLVARLLLVLLSLATTAQAASFGSNYVTIGGSNRAANGTYFTNSNTLAGSNSAAKSFRAVGNLGSFDRGTGSLLLSGEANITNENGNGNAAVSVTLSYRVYPAGTPISDRPDFTDVSLSRNSSTGGGANAVSNWKTPSTYQLLSGTTPNTAGYTLELFYQVTSARGAILLDNNSNNNYLANFRVTGAAPATWTGATSNDWFTDSNWSTGVRPNFQTDVTIALGSATRYPTISGTGNVAQVRTLTLDKSRNPNSITTLLTLNSADLQVFGDFINSNSGFKQNSGFFTLAGINQTFDGTSFTDFRIKGGGVKTLTTQMNILNTLTFYNDNMGGIPGGILATNTVSADDYNVTLATSGAQIVGESETSYVLGILRAIRTLTRGTTNTYGNIGIDVNVSLASPEDPGSSIVTRRTGLSLDGAGPTSTSASITRNFTFSAIDFPDNQIFSLSFRYLNTELNSLNAANLGFYRSISGVAPFDNLNRTSSNPSTKTVVSGIITGSLAATFTLGTTNLPLPVTLVSFTAAPTAQGAAILRWATATETNNKGFGIERQLAHGDTWQPVGYLASGNNATGGTYEYTDKSLINAASTPQAYYRLRQEDQDGTVSYSPVAVVARQAAVASTELLLSPVPVTGSNISLTFAEASQAGSEISIINTQGQRLYSQTTQASGNAALSLPVEHLAAGVYIVSVRVPGQAVRHARFVKL
ncbi:T9SS type A sorting domain-containing protein [Hymenobacter sp. BT559]|nr:T9SS type A sorting domain-containing protein [Hymenobacter sp. BT559]